MSRHLVVDASVAAKWLVPEEDSAKALRLLEDPGLTLHAPELLIAELANVLWARVRRGDLSRSEALDAGAAMSDMPILQHPHADIFLPALDIAILHDVTVYDALYVALAGSLESEVVTCDRRLEAAGPPGSWPVRLL